MNIAKLCFFQCKVSSNYIIEHCSTRWEGGSGRGRFQGWVEGRVTGGNERSDQTRNQRHRRVRDLMAAEDFQSGLHRCFVLMLKVPHHEITCVRCFRPSVI